MQQLAHVDFTVFKYFCLLRVYSMHITLLFCNVFKILTLKCKLYRRGAVNLFERIRSEDGKHLGRRQQILFLRPPSWTYSLKSVSNSHLKMRIIILAGIYTTQ